MIELKSLNLKNKRVLIRSDLNVPIKDGCITSDIRIQTSIPTIKYAIDQGAKVMISSHLGRPNEGEFNPNHSLKPVADKLSENLGCNVELIKNWINGNFQKNFSNYPVLLENVRFLKGETENDNALSKQIAKLCDVFVMDAFGTAHRKHASTYGVGFFAHEVCAGPLLFSEINTLSRIFKKPSHPVVSIVGGSKVSSKLGMLDSLANVCDTLIVGGGIANTFLAAKGLNIGKSLCEPTLISVARSLLEKINIPLPKDVVVCKHIDKPKTALIKSVQNIEDDDYILDIGPKTQKIFHDLLINAGTIIWNGPVGMFEVNEFQEGTKALAQSIAMSQAFSMAGGGDTLASIEKYHVGDNISYKSTGGGAFLQYIESKTLPVIEMLSKRT